MTFTSFFIGRSKKIILFFQCLIACLIGFILLSIHKTYYLQQRNIVIQDTNKVQEESIKLTHKVPHTFPYTIITGSSANHVCSLENFLYSLHQFRPEIEPDQFPKVVVYNIGLNRTQLPILEQLQHNGLIDEVIMFDHERYPRFWDVAIDAGQYGWKTGIINDARVRYGGVLVWLDAGNQVTKDFILNIKQIILEDPFYGFWSPKSAYGMGKWTHRGMFKFFGADEKIYKYKSNCNGAAIGFDTTNSTIVNTIIIPWFECALQKNCIAPPGSNRANHRQDQAVLTYLAYLNGHKCIIHPREFYKLQTHRDVACRSNLIELNLQNKLHHPSSIDSPKWEKVDTIVLYNHPEWKYPQDKIPINIRKPL
ncbi:uncharacterized protein BX663DRAFT_81485 [Cokeromyces recurvatus]|uniref:uncharacterized protein n=1 Tax=Cokeromyces recurvatus TaxID=90255 RepID=UPI00221ECDE8|nr:uncharacterized protein BX663DRAFT_81485 [Cokeromyces recurvatus]KAI7902094.1 hypothetical protein BX663DRAFT_81485 [Cokeromyces recurvatus]